MNENESTSPYAGLASKIRKGKSASTLELESRKPTIKIVRRKRAGLSFFRLFFSTTELIFDSTTFKVFINRVHHQNLSPGESTTIEVEPGKVELSVSTMGVRAVEVHELEMGDQIAFLCSASIGGLLLTRRH